MRRSLIPLVFLVAGCGPDATGPEAPRPSLLLYADGNTQHGTVGRPLSRQVSVRVLDQYQQPFEGAVVQWVAAEGTVDAGASVSGPDGIATATWTLGPTHGTHALEARLEGSPPVAFTAYAVAKQDPFVVRFEGGGALRGQWNAAGELECPVHLAVSAAGGSLGSYAYVRGIELVWSSGNGAPRLERIPNVVDWLGSDRLFTGETREKKLTVAAAGPFSFGVYFEYDVGGQRQAVVSFTCYAP